MHAVIRGDALTVARRCPRSRQPADDLGRCCRTPAARHVVAAPRADRWHTRSTPLLGGSGIFAGFLVAVGIAVAAGVIPASRELGGIVGGCAILFVAGLVDDLFSLPPLAKLAAQVGAAALVLASGVHVADHLQRRRSRPRSRCSGSSG